MNIDPIARASFLTLPAHLRPGKCSGAEPFFPFVAAHSAPPTQGPAGRGAVILNTSQRACRLCPGVIYFNNLNILQALPKCLL